MLARIFGWGRAPAPAREVPADADRAAQALQQGNDALARGDLATAQRCYRDAAAADPGNPLARLNLGFALLESGQPAAAVEALDQAVALRRPGDHFLHEAHFLAGRAREALGDRDLAIACHGRALAAQPAFEEPLQAAVSLLLAAGRAGEALEWARKAIPSMPSATPRMLAARALHALGRPGEALAEIDALLLREPGHAGALDVRATLLLELDRGEEALQAFAARLAAQPGDATLLTNLSAALLQLGRPGEALAVASDGVRQHPLNIDLRYHEGLARLSLGELPAGWEGYEARWGSAAFERKAAPGPSGTPRWHGQEPLQGRSILLCAEQGLGDTLQFLRFVPLVAAQAREVVLQVQRELLELAGELPANCRVLPLDAQPPATDWQCALLSLPHALRTGLAGLEPPARLSVDPAKVRHWRARLDAGPARKVGLAWSGNPVHKNDRHRSIPLAEFRALAGDGVHCVSLQPEVRASDRLALEEWPALQHFGGELRSFADTAALLQSLDLVVTVDTSVAHLAASLGRPTWILVPFNPDWRWLQGREDTPWYPAARLFRQPRAGDWSSVLQRVRRELAAPA